jgi:hypothetical protein
MKEENKQIVFTGALSLGDLHKATRYQWTIQRKYPLAYIIVFLSLMSFMLYKVFMNETPSPQMAILLTAFTVIIGSIVGLTALYFAIKKRTETIYKLDPALSKEARYSANDLRIKIEMINEVVRRYEWKDILKSYEFSDMFLVYVNAMIVIYIPKYFFDTQEEVKDFSALLSQKTTFKIR